MKKDFLLVKKMTLFAMLLALCYLLPFLTGNNQQLGNMFCLMHYPVFICGFILKEKWGTLLGFIAPLTRSLFFSKPPLYPTALCMAIELALYGLVCGLMFRMLSKHQTSNKRMIFNLYISLIVAMLIGRLGWGFSRFIIGLVEQNSFTFNAFMSAAFISAWIGIILQLIIIPPLIFALKKMRILNQFDKRKAHE